MAPGECPASLRWIAARREWAIREVLALSHALRPWWHRELKGTPHRTISPIRMRSICESEPIAMVIGRYRAFFARR